MNQAVLARIGIGASIIGAVGAIAYLIRGNPPGVIGLQGPQGTPGSPGSPGSPAPSPATTPVPDSSASVAPSGTATGPIGSTNTTGAAGGNAVAGTNANVLTNNLAGPAAVTPTIDQITNQYIQNFSAPPDGAAASPLTYNLPSFSDLGKNIMNFANSPAITGDDAGGCGCGNGSPCPNTRGPYLFHDGAGACAATSPMSLAITEQSCAPGFMTGQFRAMAQALNFGASTPEQFWGSFQSMIAHVPSSLDLNPNYVPVGQFGITPLMQV